MKIDENSINCNAIRLIDNMASDFVDNNVTECDSDYKTMPIQPTETKTNNLFSAYNSLKKYLENHTALKQIISDVNNGFLKYRIIKKDLRYGYKIDGFEKINDMVIWKIVTYERPIKQNDVVRGIDDCYLITKDETTVEAANRIDYELMCGNHDFSDDEYETYIKEYIDISNID